MIDLVNMNDEKRLKKLGKLHDEIARYGNKHNGNCDGIDIDRLIEKFDESTTVIEYFIALYVINYDRKVSV